MTHETFQAPELSHLAELLPAFEFQAFIAQGGMGAVYKARQKSLERDVAIKVLPRELGADPEFRESFRVEAKAMAKMNHPNLIAVYDYGDVDGMPYIVMEYVDGKSLYHSAWNKQIEAKQAVAIISGICAGLGHAHENGVIHRDIKPANILLTPKAEPKIGDFGLAQAAEHDHSGIVMGTPGYTAPEVLQDHTASDQRADLFAVGVILHELITGQRPDPEGKNPRQRSGDPKLDAIWQKATQDDPAQRYSTAEEMGADLKKWSESGGKRVVTPVAASASPLVTGGSGGAGGRPVPAAGGRPAPAPQVSVPAGSNWSMIRNLLIIAALLVAIGYTYKFLKEEKARRAAEQAQIDKENFEARQKAEADRKRAIKEAQLAAQRAKEEAENRPPTPPEPEPETPIESLERLRRDLSKGLRTEMPIGTKRKGDSDFFVVTKQMSWHAAAAFAEEHGGHLAVVNTDEDINWFAQLLPRDSSAWVGAGRSFGKSWIQIDGTQWPLSKRPSGVGDYAAVDELGLIRARPASSKFPFIIEWHRDGSNPASLASILQRTRETINSPNPVFPPGTKALDGRYFAIISRPIKRLNAEILAEQSQGILAVPASREEAGWLTEKSAELGKGLKFWLGGTRKKKLWSWDTGETWEFAEWADDANPEDGGENLVLLSGEGWSDADPSEKMDGLIIEWSNDAERAVGSEGEGEIETAGDTSSLEGLNEMASTALERAIKDRDDKLAANARTFGWDLNVWLRGLNGSDTAKWKRHVEALQNMVEDDRVPKPDDLDDGDQRIKLSPRMAKVCQYGYQKQQEILLTHESVIDRIRDAYVDKVNEAAAAAKAKGQDGLANNLRRASSDASDDLDGWVEGLVD